jgi:DNA-directed RNA polymerase specialized sigma24 family protein
LLNVTRDHGLRDQDEFERMFRTRHDAVRAYALRRTAVDDANDIVAETFLVAWRRFDEAPRDFLLAWLFGVARRVLANQRRASNRRDALAIASAPLSRRRLRHAMSQRRMRTTSALRQRRSTARSRRRWLA